MSENHITVKGAVIDWRCQGRFNFTSGYGATRAEHALANYAALIVPVILYFFSWRELNWNLWQVGIAAVLTLDMVGGVLTNSLNSMKRFLHTEGNVSNESWLAQLVRSRFLFPAIHGQLYLVPLFFDVGWSYAFIWYTIMMLSVLLLHFLPLYLHRPVALLAVMLSIILSDLLPSPIGLTWLAPVFIIKLVLSHGVREEPYRPKVLV
ncbi:hypothetical protein [Vibrio coralliilyticus]|uniref:hypothetical protein n=1 Tax=Vibrio coralliilyticus TaxID=190893 RepID=UPI00148E6144|nr:hypothetical protein [Vibrio coralliilyticus]NOI50001.1 hypothetical protein [Vibrio coralliilyticus]